MASSNSTKLNLDVAKRLDITCRKGDSFQITMNVTDASGSNVDFSAFTDIVFQVRPTDEDTGTPVLEFDFPSDYDTGTVGTLVVSKSSTVMSTLSSGIYVYDMQFTDSNSKTVTWFYGLFVINDDVSF